jgi:hypothetical protein
MPVRRGLCQAGEHATGRLMMDRLVMDRLIDTGEAGGVPPASSPSAKVVKAAGGVREGSQTSLEADPPVFRSPAPMPSKLTTYTH